MMEVTPENLGKFQDDMSTSCAGDSISSLSQGGKDRLILALRQENAELRKRCSLLEAELSIRGVNVEELQDGSNDDSVSHGGDSNSTMSRMSNFDLLMLNNNAIRSHNIARALVLEDVEQEHILGQVRHRRFTLTQEKKIISNKNRNKSDVSAKKLEENGRKTESSKGSEKTMNGKQKDAGDDDDDDDEEEEEEKKEHEDEDGDEEVDEEEYDENDSVESTEHESDDGIDKIKKNRTIKRKRRKSKYANKSDSTNSVFGKSKVPVHQLPRGGIYVQTSKGPVQFGIPPETIKDAMKMGLEVPKFFVVPKDRFNLKLGLNMCEVEFPAYFNFFLRKSSVNLVATPMVENVVRRVIDETLEGPEEKFLHVDQEYPQESSEQTGRFAFAARPNHVKEINFFKEPRDGRQICTDTLVGFTHFLPPEQQMDRLSEEAIRICSTAQKLVEQILAEDKSGKFDPKTASTSSSSSSGRPNIARQNEIYVAILSNGIEIVDCGSEYVVIDNGESVATVQSFLTSWAPSPSPTTLVPKMVTDPPQFGVTVMGSSDGFDPNGSTSGFVLWMHKKGIMVDPPPNATELLQAAGIIPSMITGIILTHCHADHDAGAFQKILKEGKITLITTETIFSSFIRKYSIISGFAESFLLRLFEHRLVKIGEYVHWGGGTLRFFYSLHALPCIGFEANVAGKTFAYSGDTFYEPEGLRKLRDNGYLSPERCDALLDFPWDYDIVLHEAGIPPIHTPLEALKALPDKVRNNLHIIHITEAKAKASGLKWAKAGVENTIVIETPQHEHATSAAILQLLRSTDIFKHFSIAQASDLLQLCRHCVYEPEEYICRAGEVGKHFYVILSGFCCVQLRKKDGEGFDLHKQFREVEDANVDSNEDGDKASWEHTPGDKNGTPRPISKESMRSYPSEEGFANQIKVFGAGDYLGELALLTEQHVRSADIVAMTKLSLIKLDKHAFKYLLDTTPGLQYRMERLSKIRCSLSWKAIGANSVLSRLGSTQRSQLQSVMQVQHVKAGTKLWDRNQPVEYAYLLASGQLEFLEMRDELETPFKAGAFFCNIASMMSKRHSTATQHLEGTDGVMETETGSSSRNSRRSRSSSKKGSKRITTSRVTLIAKTDADLYYIEEDDILEFLDQNPGVFINLIDSLVME